MLPFRCPLAALSLALLGLAACGGSPATPVIGGPCTYASFPGTATCTEITTNNYGSVAHFSFKPTDPNAPAQYLLHTSDTDISLSLYGSGTPTAGWLAANGIVVGRELACIRQEERTGTCTPLLFSFPALPEATAQ